MDTQNRIIKFRAWDKKEKKMYYSGEGDSWHIFEFCGKTQWALVNNVYEAKIRTDYHNGVFMQFTGLLDKNRKEIYEGDIIKKGDTTREIKWGKSYDGGEYGGIYMGFNFDGYDLEEIKESEVIGNIYENPELLK